MRHQFKQTELSQIQSEIIIVHDKHSGMWFKLIPTIHLGLTFMVTIMNKSLNILFLD